MNLLKLANVPISDAARELVNLPLLSVETEKNQEVYGGILNLPEPHRTATIELLIKEQSTKLFFVENPGEKFEIRYQKQTVVIEKGSNPYTLEVALYVLTKFGAGTNKSYGYTNNSVLRSGEAPGNFKQPNVESKLSKLQDEYKEKENKLANWENELKGKEAQLKKALAELDKQQENKKTEKEPEPEKPKAEKTKGTKV